MTLGMMQPYFLPYLGYYALIQKTDTWVVFDDSQYIRHGWINRNRILHPNGSWQYVNIPLTKAPLKTPINKMMVNNMEWGNFILRQLNHYKQRAPFYAPVVEFLAESFYSAPKELDKLLVFLLDASCNYIGLNFNPKFNSSIDYDRNEIHSPGDWALVVAKTLKAQSYLNPISGQTIFQDKQWIEANIKLQFLECPITPYPQLHQKFEPHLSIVDAMMFNTPQQIRDMLTQTSIISLEK